MRPSDRDYLAQRVFEARNGIERPRVVGINRTVRQCSHCGKSNLDKTVEVRMPNGSVSYYGSECADQIRSVHQAELDSRYRSRPQNPDEGEDEDEYEDDEEDGADDNEDEDENEDPHSRVNPYADPNNPYVNPNYGNYYAAANIDPLPNAESALSIDNFDRRFQICDVIFDSRHGSGATGYNANIRYMGFGALMMPKKFLSLALPLHGTYDASIRHLLEHKRNPGWGPPFLYVDFSNGVVHGHEGRHRVNAFIKECPGQPLLVHILPMPEANKPTEQKEMRARAVTKDILKKARKGLFSETYHQRSEAQRADPFWKKQDFVEGPLFSTVFLENQEIDL